MKTNIQMYLNNLDKPWSKLYYRLVKEQLSYIQHKKILDYGSGFGVMSDYFAKENDVIAIEPDNDMVISHINNFPYLQLHGGLNKLKELKEDMFDVIVCHNVFEYMEEKEQIEVLREFHRLLKTGGQLSIIKHNQPGRVLQTVVFHNDLNEALHILDNHEYKSISFGKVREYNLEKYLKETEWSLINKYGIRTFFALYHDNVVKEDLCWQDKMYQIEKKVSTDERYQSISFFHHYIYTKR